MVAYSAVGMSKVAFAQSKNIPPERPRNPVRELPLRRFDIEPGALGIVLDAFAAASELQVEIANPALRELSSPGVAGLYTTPQALQSILAGTGATFRFKSAQAVTIQLEQVVTSVEVTAEALQLQLSMPKYSEALLDTPQTITVISNQLIEQQAATTLRDTLRNVAGISLAAGEGGAQGDNLTIRGFSARNDLLLDGMRDFGSYYRDTFNTEEVQVLQGPSSVTFGRGSTGGVVNQSSKYPQLARFIAAEALFGTDGTRRVGADLETPLPRLGDGAAFRLNLMGNQGNVAGRDVAESRRFGIAPSLAFGLGSSTRLTLGYFHQTSDDIPDYGIPWLFDSPAPVDRHNYYGFEDGDFLRTYVDAGTARVDHELNSRIVLRNQVRFSNYVRDAQITEARVPATVTPQTPLAAINVTRNQISVNSVETFLDDQLDLTMRLRTGPVQHSIVTGFEASRETSDPTRPTWTGVPVTSLLDPNPGQPFSGRATIASRVNTSAVTVGGYVLDTMRFGQKWELTGGIRLERFDADYRQYAAPAAAYSRVDAMPSWRAGLVYKPRPAGSLYVAASTSFNPSAESLSLSASTADLPPEKNRNVEVGSKWDLKGGRLSLRGALFQTEKLNAREPDPDNSLLNVLAGVQRVRGIEVEVRGRITSRWDVFSGYAHLNGRVISSNFYPAAVGARLANVPADTFTIWNNIRLPARFQAGLGANYVSSRTASSTVPYDPVTGLVKQVPGYWVFNAMAARPVNEHIDLQVNIYNLANRYYYDQLHPGHIVLGPGLSALGGVKFKF